mgnify:CR=1 FL=1
MTNDMIMQTISNIMEIFTEAPYSHQSFVEALEIIKNYIQEGDITIYGKDNEIVSRIATTLIDMDELRCLDRIILSAPPSADISHLGDRREGVTDMLYVPLNYGNSAGIMVYEKYSGQIDMVTKEENLLFHVLSVCLAIYIQHREIRRNFYMDSLTGLPDQNYFLLCMDKMKTDSLSQWILVTRIVDCSSQIQIMGSKNWSSLVTEVAELLRSSNKTYRIGCDTFATVISGSKSEAYETVISLKEKLRSKYDFKMLLLDILLYDDLLAVIEKEIIKCRQGTVLIPDKEDSSILDIFKPKSKKKYQKPSMASKILDSTDIDLFDLL